MIKQICLITVFYVFAVSGTVTAVNLRVQEAPLEAPPQTNQVCKTCTMIYDMCQTAHDMYNASEGVCKAIARSTCIGYIGPEWGPYKETCKDIAGKSKDIIKFIKKDIAPHPACQQMKYCSPCRPCPAPALCIICDDEPVGEVELDEDDSIIDLDMPFKSIIKSVKEFASNIYTSVHNITSYV